MHNGVLEPLNAQDVAVINAKFNRRIITVRQDKTAPFRYIRSYGSFLPQLTDRRADALVFDKDIAETAVASLRAQGFLAAAVL